MQSTFMFSEDERQLLLDLLVKEHRELRPEIRHTDNREVRSTLKDRLALVDFLVERLEVVPVP